MDRLHIAAPRPTKAFLNLDDGRSVLADKLSSDDLVLLQLKSSYHPLDPIYQPRATSFQSKNV